MRSIGLSPEFLLILNSNLLSKFTILQAMSCRESIRVPLNQNPGFQHQQFDYKDTVSTQWKGFPSIKHGRECLIRDSNGCLKT